MGKTGPVGKEMSKSHLLFRMLFIGAVDCKIRKIGSDRLIKVQKTVLDGHQHTKGRKTLGHGLNAENGFRVYGSIFIPARMAEDLLPENFLIVHNSNCHSGRLAFLKPIRSL